MSKSYKKKIQKEDIIIEEETQSKKELYDLEKLKKQEEREKKQKKKKKNGKKKVKKTYQTSLGGRIFAVVMLVLMIGSVIATVGTYLIK